MVRSSARPSTIGLRAAEKPYHFRDIHTTILHQLGLDQHRLTYPHLGRDERLDIRGGSVIEKSCDRSANQSASAIRSLAWTASQSWSDRWPVTW